MNSIWSPICLLIPAFLFCAAREIVSGRKAAWNLRFLFRVAAECVCGGVLVNGGIILGRRVLLGETDNVLVTFSQFPGFAVKYLVLASAAAVALPVAKKFLKERVVWDFKIGKSLRFEIWESPITITPPRKFRVPDLLKTAVVWLFALFFAGHYFFRMFDNSVWGDEAIVVGLVRKSWGGMLAGVAGNGHSPLHYAVAWLLVKLFGESGFVFHLSAALPYYLLLVLSATLIRKWFGRKTAVAFMTLCSLLECAILYNVEIRMYVWCQLFILLTYLMLYKVLQTQQPVYYVWMALFSLGAVYSHYFALAGVGLLYFGLLLYAVFARRQTIWRVLLSGGSVLLFFAPWLFYAKTASGRVISNYGIEQVSLYDCIEFIFHSDSSMVLLASFFVVLTVWFVYDHGILGYSADGKKKYVVHARIFPKIRINARWAWVFSGLAAVFGTIAAAELFSHLFFPIICLRYLYQTYIIVWFLFALAVSNTKLSLLWTAVLVYSLFDSSYQVLCLNIRSEIECNARLQSTLQATRPEIDENDLIYTDINHFAWTVEHAYYPDTPNVFLGESFLDGEAALPELNADTQNWLFLSAPVTEEVTAALGSQQMTAEPVVENGYIGTGNVWIYRVTNQS